MTRDEAIRRAKADVVAQGRDWLEPAFAGRQWVFRRCWFRWVVTAPAPTRSGSSQVTINDRTGRVEENRFIIHFGTPALWLKRGVVRSDLDESKGTQRNGINLSSKVGPIPGLVVLASRDVRESEKRSGLRSE
jgi:hypothetical protein